MTILPFFRKFEFSRVLHLVITILLEATRALVHIGAYNLRHVLHPRIDNLDHMLEPFFYFLTLETMSHYMHSITLAPLCNAQIFVVDVAP